MGVRRGMQGRKGGFPVAVAGLCLLSAVPCAGMKPAPDKAKVETEGKLIHQMASTHDIDGLIRMLSTGEFPSREAAAEHLGEIGDDRAVPELMRLNRANGGWAPGPTGEDRSGVFAVAVCRILTRGRSQKEQIDALFELLEGKGPAVPVGVPPVAILNGKEIPGRLDKNLWVGERVAEELDKFSDPSIVTRLRASENQGVSPYAVWREVREMDTEAGIARCQQIARDEERSQQYGAIHCLERFGPQSIEALNQLAREGHGEAIVVLSRWKGDPNVFDLLCRHATTTRNYWARSQAVSAISYVFDPSLEVRSLTVLIEALYDPSERIRERAATALLNRAYPHKKRSFDQIEDSLRTALSHPDPEVSSRIRQGMARLGYESLDVSIRAPRAIRTDLEARSPLPLTASRRLKIKTDSLEKEAAQAMGHGQAEKAAELYEQLLDLKPGHEPYDKALEAARARIAEREQLRRR